MINPLLLRFLTAMSIAFFAAIAVLWFFVSYKILSNSSNHFGVNIGWMRLIALVGIVLTAVIYVYTRRIAFFIAALLFVLSMVGGYALDYYNILLPYELWLNRGMPSRRNLL
jgi:hypothetical protein